MQLHNDKCACENSWSFGAVHSAVNTSYSTSPTVAEPNLKLADKD